MVRQSLLELRQKLEVMKKEKDAVETSLTAYEQRYRAANPPQWFLVIKETGLEPYTYLEEDLEFDTAFELAP